MAQSRNTKSAKEETQKAQTESGFFLRVLRWFQKNAYGAFDGVLSLVHNILSNGSPPMSSPSPDGSK
jgi:hypothetical protein